MNGHGDTLLIGVNEDHEPVALENDYKVTKKGNRDPRDSFENWLADLLDNTIGKPALANVSVALVVPAVDGAATMLQPEQDTPGQSRKTTVQETPKTA